MEYITGAGSGPGIIVAQEQDRNVRTSGTYNRSRLHSCTGIIPGTLAEPELTRLSRMCFDT